MGALLEQGLGRLPGVARVRGRGLLLGAVLEEAVAPDACRRALEAGLILNAPRPDVVRLAPSLLVSPDEIDEALGILGPILADEIGGGGEAR